MRGLKSQQASVFDELERAECMGASFRGWTYQAFITTGLPYCGCEPKTPDLWIEMSTKDAQDWYISQSGVPSRYTTVE